MKVVEGDLVKMALDGEFDVIIHGCNCQGVMGAGIAKQIRKEMPAVYDVFKKDERKPTKKLGFFSFAEVTDKLIVVNAYIQMYYGNDGGKYIDYDAVYECMHSIKTCFGFRGLRFGYPKIGAGLAGGKWDIISSIIDDKLEGEDHTLVILGS